MIFFWCIAENALRSNCTYNILLDKNIDIHRYLLKNETDGEIFETFLTEDELFSKLANDTVINILLSYSPQVRIYVVITSVH